MKQTLINAGILVFVFSICFASCKKDKKEDPKNSFKYNQTESEINTVMGFQYGESPVTGVYGIEMDFVEKSLTVHYSNNYPDSVSGSGDLLVVTFLTNSINAISPGVYNFLPTTDPYKSFAIAGDGISFLLINLVASSNTDPDYLDVSGGKVTVGKSGDEYEFTFDLKTTANKDITGYYKGKPTIYNSKKKKSGAPRTWFPQANQTN